jgi:hypothetical protein
MRKNKFFILGVLAMVLLLGLVLMGCSTDSSDGGTGYTLKIVNENSAAITHVKLSITAKDMFNGDVNIPSGGNKDFAIDMEDYIALSVVVYITFGGQTIQDGATYYKDDTSPVTITLKADGTLKVEGDH